MKNIGTQNISTERLLLRRIKIDDAESMFKNWASDDDVTKYLRWKAHKDIETTKEVINLWLQKYQNEQTYIWAIVYKETDVLIGTIEIMPVDKEPGTAQAGYCIAKKYWNKGIMTEALKSVIDYMFSKVELKKIVAWHLVDNEASGKVMQKSGMKFKGLKKSGDKDCDGNLRDIIIYETMSTSQSEPF